MLHSQLGYVLGISDSQHILSCTDIDALNVASLKKEWGWGRGVIQGLISIITLCIEAAKHCC